MDIDIIKSEKDEMELELGNITIAELLRVYLNKDSSVTFVAWRRDHPTKLPRLLVKTKGKTAKKAVVDAIKEVEKELDKLDSDFKKLK
jgi:DNA-directed RNA polymerase subunit L